MTTSPSRKAPLVLPAAPKSQTGAVTLIVTLVLLFGMTLMAFFANRTLIFEQKTSANQYRSSKAAQAAEAGLEWALANLNHSIRIDNSCVSLASPGSGDRNFRSRYLDPDDNAATVAFSALTPGCVWNGSAWACTCPSAGASSPAGTGAAFIIVFETVGSDRSLVRVNSTGCTSWPCDSADARATVSQIFKLQPALATPPAAPLTAKGSVNFGSNAITVSNTDTATNGITINAGGAITGAITSATVRSVPGTPVQNSLIGQDASLSALSDDQMFQTFFGQSKDSFKNAASTTQLACPTNCTSLLENSVTQGAQTIWIEGDMSLNSNATIGSPSKPVVIVVSGNAHLNGNLSVYGVVYSANTTWDNTGGGGAKVYGAIVAEGNFTTTGTPDPTYDPAVFDSIRASTGQFVRVLGSWRDF